MRKLVLLTVVGALMITASPCWAVIPHLINYQGMLTDDAGNPINEPRDLTFTIYNVPAGGVTFWTETLSAVTIENGLFNVILGDITPIPDSVFNEPERYLGIKVGSDPELAPRIQLTSVGYAYRAGEAQYAEASGTAETDGDWTINGDDMHSAVSGNVGIGTTSPDRRLDVNGQISLRPGGLANAGIWLKTPAGVDDWYMGKTDIGGTNQIGFYKGDWRMVVDSSGYVGMGTTSPSANLHIKGYPSTYLCFDHSGDRTWYLGSNQFDNQNLQILVSIGGGSLTRAAFKPDGDIILAPLIGNVGIGSGAPDRKLHISGDNPRILIEAQTSNPEVNFMSTGDPGSEVWALYKDTVSNDFRFYQGGDKVTIENSTGNVGIGTTDPTDKLDINSNGIRIRNARTPASASADGYTGEIVWDAGYIYICISGDGPGGITDTWKRAALTTW